MRNLCRLVKKLKMRLVEVGPVCRRLSTILKRLLKGVERNLNGCIATLFILEMMGLYPKDLASKIAFLLLCATAVASDGA